MRMKNRTYLILGIVFLAIGITMLMTGAVSRTMAYGDFVLAFAFVALSAKAGKKSEDDKKDEEQPEEDKKTE